MVNYYNSIIETIGKTPLVKLNRITKDVKPNIFVKLESFNPNLLTRVVALRTELA